MPMVRSTLSRPRTPPASAPKIPASENGRISARRRSVGRATYMTAITRGMKAINNVSLAKKPAPCSISMGSLR